MRGSVVQYKCDREAMASPIDYMKKELITMKLDKRRKYYLILDCETATLPYAANFPPEQKKNIAIAKPLIYDLGWQIVDIRGNVYKRASYLISEIFSVPAVFNTAYYASKRPIYLDRLKAGEIRLTDWNTAVAELVEDMDMVEAVGAYNSMFDFKKALPFTELYVSKLYSPDFFEWEQFQNERCEQLAHGYKPSAKEFDPEIFKFRKKDYPLFDLWGLSCEHLLNNPEYKQMCHDNDWSTASGKYYPTNAEKAFAYCFQQQDFEEAHTALEDAMIESMLFALIGAKTKHKFTRGIEYFPFRKLGRYDNDWEL